MVNHPPSVVTNLTNEKNDTMECHRSSTTCLDVGFIYYLSWSYQNRARALVFCSHVRQIYGTNLHNKKNESAILMNVIFLMWSPFFVSHLYLLHRVFVVLLFDSCRVDICVCRRGGFLVLVSVCALSHRPMRAIATYIRLSPRFFHTFNLFGFICSAVNSLYDARMFVFFPIEFSTRVEDVCRPFVFDLST